MSSALDPDLLRAATVLSCALGCGMLVGIERERRKGSGPHRALAGLRTFTLTCVMGAAAALSGITVWWWWARPSWRPWAWWPMPATGPTTRA
ncbi:MgtC/SapB family protein [uncultured Hydrogenophaga sp.]|uniref:MgtC/SapB family protein n=1 Tax=uncultured Hydrogenophaga sp. TaxID=199683 RepID=UPI00265E9675|nr:MgtC/SapB family protein [uncultured Hydrogenophaga sp.]